MVVSVLVVEKDKATAPFHIMFNHRGREVTAFQDRPQPIHQLGGLVERPFPE
jgi:hypothetical protein